jgi:regulatory protein
MANGALADGSSSPSARSSLVSFETVRKDERAGDTVYRIRLSTGSSFIVPGRYLGDLVATLGSGDSGGSGSEGTVGLPIDDELIAEIRLSAEAYQAEKKAVELLARSEHTELLLRRKLEKREFSSRAIGKTLVFLKDTGWLSDGRFASEWVESKLRREGRSLRKLYADLVSHGVSPELAEDTLRSLVSPETEFENISRAAKKLTRSGRISGDILVSRLLSRGFPLKLIKKYLASDIKD